MFDAESFDEILAKAKQEAAYWAGYKKYFQKHLDNEDFDWLLDDALDLARKAENLRQSIIADEKLVREMDTAEVEKQQELKFGYTPEIRGEYVSKRQVLEDRIVIKALNVWRLRAGIMETLENAELDLRPRQKPRRPKRHIEEIIGEE